ncbi:MAG: hypothetical protein OXE77_06560 [Flavobacteriaceae bacterium]|nr:hypothetical protein [Flavobacteriaceae bacterium]MCY4268080.1 hypothetical protein [Flavobacteriaceae bacterium]MCY4298566.1 hypothetical protein [Flavobacteriaceae bacterium]
MNFLSTDTEYASKPVKVARIVTLILSFLGLYLLLRVLFIGDEQIEMGAAVGDFGPVSSFVGLAIITLLLTTLVTLLFALRDIFRDRKTLRKSLLAIGLFLGAFLIAFLLSSGEETPMKDNQVLSAAGSRMVETGLKLFFILVIVAFFLMIWGGVSRIFKPSGNA